MAWPRPNACMGLSTTSVYAADIMPPIQKPEATLAESSREKAFAPGGMSPMLPVARAVRTPKAKVHALRPWTSLHGPQSSEPGAHERRSTASLSATCSGERPSSLEIAPSIKTPERDANGIVAWKPRPRAANTTARYIPLPAAEVISSSAWSDGESACDAVVATTTLAREVGGTVVGAKLVREAYGSAGGA